MHSGNWSTSDFFPVLLHLAASPQLCRLWWHAAETHLLSWLGVLFNKISKEEARFIFFILLLCKHISAPHDPSNIILKLI